MGISVFLADRQVLFREGIHFILSSEEDIEVIGEATGNGEALTFVEANPPSVVILDVDHGEISGIEVTRRIQQTLPSVGVILIMGGDNEEQLFSAMKSGARACLVKDADPADLVNIIREVAQGKYLISENLLRPGIASRVVEEFEVFSLLSEQVDGVLTRLSPGEAEILRRIAKGGSSELVAKAMGISEGALQHRLGLIQAKLVANEHNRVVIEAVLRSLPSIISGVAFRAG